MSTKKRTLPGSAKFWLLVNGKSGIGAFFGLLFGLIMVLIAFSSMDFYATVYLNFNVEIGDGEILEVYETNTEINGVPVCGYDYVFHSPIGDLYWTSYTGGFIYDVGDKVKIEYNRDMPDVHRIKGMRNTSGSALFLIPLILAIGWVIYNYIVGRKKIKIIKNGELAEGRLIYKEATSTEINEKTVYKLTFSFQSASGDTYEVTTKTHEPEWLEDENTETLIYDKDNPNKALLLDDLPFATGEDIRKGWS